MIDAWRALTADWPVLQTISDSLWIVVPLASLLAYTGLYFISATAKIIGVSKKRNIFEKCSRQLAFLALWLGWIILACARVWLYFLEPPFPENTLAGYMTEMSWLLFSMGVLLGTIYYFLWKPLKNMPVLHVTLGMLAAIQNCVALASILFTLKICASGPPFKIPCELPEIFPQVWDAAIFSAACYTLLLIFSLAGAFGLLWLILRRKKDDFGRDYYNLTLRWCAAWANYPWLLLILFLLIGAGQKIWAIRLSLSLEDLVYNAALVIISLIPAACWLAVQKSALPMRRKLLCWLAAPIAAAFAAPYYLFIISV